MKNFTHQKSRQSFPDRFQRQGSLPDRRSLMIIVYSLLVLLPAFLVLSCRKTELPDHRGEPEAPAVKDSAVFVISFEAEPRTIRSLDIFIYDTEGVQALEKHISRKDMPPSLEVKLSKGDKTVAAVANSPKRFKTASMSRHSALSQVSYEFKEDSRDAPIMSGSAKTRGEKASISLKPMLCEVVLKSIGNTMEDYELLESPRIRLRGINARASFFTEEKHLPAETIDKGEWASLPYDIGYYPQETGTLLLCYPNETAESNIGQDRTSLELECLIKGRKCSFLVDLPPFGRASRTEVSMTVDGPGSFSYSVNEPSSGTCAKNTGPVSRKTATESRTEASPHTRGHTGAPRPS